MSTLNKKTRLNSHDKLIFDGFMSRQPLDQITFASDAEKARVFELCRRAFLKGMEHESLLNE
jgi:hypothetical protein